MNFAQLAAQLDALVTGTYSLTVQRYRHAAGDSGATHATLEWAVWLSGPAARVEAPTAEALLDAVRAYLGGAADAAARSAEVGEVTL